MFKNLKMGTKIASIAALLMAMLLIVAWVGHNGISSVVDRSYKVREVNGIVRGILSARAQEKNFILRRDSKYADVVTEQVSQIRARSSALKDKFTDQINQDQMDEVITKVNEYQLAFQSVVEIDKQRRTIMDQMRTIARQTLTDCEAISDDQKSQLEAAHEAGEIFIDDKLAKANDANRLVKWFIEVRKNEKEVIISEGSNEYKSKVDEGLAQIKNLSANLRTRFKQQLNIDQIDRFSTALQSYTLYFNELYVQVKARRNFKDIMNQMRVSAAVVLKELEAIRADQKSQLDEARKNQTIFLLDKINKSDDANHLIQWFIDARKNEKEVILSQESKYVEAVKNQIAKIKALSQDLRIRFKNPKNIQQIDAVITSVDSYEKYFQQYLSMLEKQEQADGIMVASAREAQKVCEQARDNQDQKMAGQIATANTTMMVGTVLSIALGIVLSFVIIRGITKAITRVVDGLNEGAEQVASASGQVSTASQSLAEGASEQAASVEETSSSLEEMASMTQQNADNATQADTLMKEANQIVTSANHSMGELTQSMEEISKASEQTSKIIKTIDEIAFQTNLLALNAAVEAARAGEAGAGFAVVADEVRNLAMRAAEAAKNTASLIEGTVKKVNDGGDLVSKTNDAFTEVAKATSKVGELVGEIAAASSEQAQGVTQINTAVNEVDKVTQQNAASAEESASAAEEMNAQAEQMRGYVSELIALVNGAGQGKTPNRTSFSSKRNKIQNINHFSSKKASENHAATFRQEPKIDLAPEKVIPLDDADFENF